MNVSINAHGRRTIDGKFPPQSSITELKEGLNGIWLHGGVDHHVR